MVTEAALVARQRYTDLDSSTLTNNTALMLYLQKVALNILWETAVNMLEQWAALLTVILGPGINHPAVYEISMLIEVAEEMRAPLWSQAYYQPEMLAALV